MTVTIAYILTVSLAILHCLQPFESWVLVLVLLHAKLEIILNLCGGLVWSHNLRFHRRIDGQKKIDSPVFIYIVVGLYLVQKQGSTSSCVASGIVT